MPNLLWISTFSLILATDLLIPAIALAGLMPLWLSLV